MKQRLWYRCAACSPDQSRDFEIEGDPPVSEVYDLVYQHHLKASPDCQLSCGATAATARQSAWASVEFLIRHVQ